MTLILFLLSVSGIFELFLHLFRPERLLVRKAVAICAVGMTAVCGVGIIAFSLNWAGILIGLVMLYRIFNIIRIIKGRMHAAYLWHTTYRTSLWLIGSQYVLLVLWFAWSRLNFSRLGGLDAALVVELFVAVVFYASVSGHARRMMAAAHLEPVHDTDLPSLTVAIPARNETDDLQACIQSVLDSKYPKLEILVLDDCSAMRRTPEIIRSFAHDGVRFIQGSEPKETWLAKNQAYDALAQAANGEYILFCGVDIRFSALTLRQILSYAIHNNKSMVCAMPQNASAGAWPSLIQPMRYAWELAFPRKIFKRPPVLSSCWLITAAALKRTGGFQAASRMIVPEAYFAKRLAEQDEYSFIAGGKTFGITSMKSVPEQRDTAVRVSYPQTHRRPEMVGFISLGYLLWAAVPLIAVAVSLNAHMITFERAAAVCIMALSLAAYSRILILAYGSMRPLSAIALPLAVIVHAALLHYSMYEYEFDEVTWKGRNVCLPVMHVIPHLPKL